MTKQAINVENVDVFFGTAHVIKNLSFSVEAGECFGLVGESGSGKSTILRVLTRLVGDWRGQVGILGQDLSTISKAQLAQKLQMVFQDPYGSLHPNMTIDDILDEPLAIHGIRGRNERISRVMSDVGLPASFRFRYPHQLSGGQRQRVAIARALLLKPPIILLDEPTSALDVSIQAEVLNLLSDLRAEHKLTYVLVSHDLGVIAHMCNRVLIMRTGQAVEVTNGERLSRGKVSSDYANELLTASIGFRKNEEVRSLSSSA